MGLTRPSVVLTLHLKLHHLSLICCGRFEAAESETRLAFKSPIQLVVGFDVVLTCE